MTDFQTGIDLTVGFSLFTQDELMDKTNKAIACVHIESEPCIGGDQR